MNRLLGVIFVFLGTTSTVVLGQNNCICGGFILKPDNHTEWFHNFKTINFQSCDAKQDCSTDCVKYFEDLTKSCDVSTPVPGEGVSFGDYVCRTVNHDVPAGSSIKFRYQLCSGWQDTGLVCAARTFCCVKGDYPESGCSAL